MPGSGDETHSSSALELANGSQEVKAPLPYLRSRNALKIILDLDLGFGRPRSGPTPV